MANIYIQTSTGLQSLGGSTTKESIENALGYVPASEDAVASIEDDGSGDLVVTDTAGNIIARVDKDGIHTTEVEADGMNLKETVEKLLAGGGSGGGGTPNITDDGSGELQIQDPEDNVIAKFDADGVHSVEFEADGIRLKETLVEHTDNAVIHVTDAEKNRWDSKSDFSGDYNDLKNKPTIPSGSATEVATALTEHKADKVVHITADERTKWNGKSDFSGSYNDLTDKPTITSGTTDYNKLENKPHIEDDGSGDFTITDSNGNIVAKVDADGFHSVGYEVDGYDVLPMLLEHQKSIENFSAGGGSVIVDDALSETSVHPVQNKVVTAKFGECLGKTESVATDSVDDKNSDELSSLVTIGFPKAMAISEIANFVSVLWTNSRYYYRREKGKSFKISDDVTLDIADTDIFKYDTDKSVMAGVNLFRITDSSDVSNFGVYLVMLLPDRGEEFGDINAQFLYGNDMATFSNEMTSFMVQVGVNGDYDIKITPL